MAMSTQSKLNHCQKHDEVKIHENLFFVNQKNKCTTFSPSTKPVPTVISCYLTECANDCIKVKLFCAERISYEDNLKIFRASVYILDNMRKVGCRWYILSSKKAYKIDFSMTFQSRC